MNTHRRPDRPDLVSSAAVSGRRRRLRVAVIVAAILAVFALAPARAHAATSAGVCTFGTPTSAGPLNIAMTSTRLTITGYGSCAGLVGTAGTNVVNMGLDGAGSFACDIGLGGMAGTILWVPAPPYLQSGFQVRIATSANVLHLVFTDTGFNAVATLTWPATDIPHCLATGTENAALTGTMTFETT